MDAFPVSSIIAGIIFLLAVIATGIWLTLKGRYHIFYFSLLGLFVLNIIIKIFAVSAAISSSISSMSVQYDSADGRSSYTPPEPGLLSGVGLSCFFMVVSIGIIFLFGLLSLVNPFIRKNKLSVRIVSGIMVLICSLFAFVVYLVVDWFYGMGKIGG